MLMTDYINPDTIFLESFGPSDVESHVRLCDFCITDYGRIDNLDIRFTDANGCEISCNNVETQSENGPKLYLCDSNREKLPKSNFQSSSKYEKIDSLVDKITNWEI